MNQLRKKEDFDSCMERLIDESEEVGAYSCSQGMFDSNQPAQPHIIGGYILNEEDNKSEDEDDEDRTLESINSNDKFVFIRLYNSIYKKGGIMVPFGKAIRAFTGTVNDAVGGYTHAAISYKLTDDFFGLTSKRKGENFSLKKESVENPESNKYIETLDTSKSQWAIYSLPVSVLEYEKVKKFLDLEIKDKLLEYGTFNLFLQALDKIGKKLYKNKQSSIEDISTNEMIGKKEILVCSTFVAYTLYTCTNYKHIFKRYGIDYNYVSPNDLVSIPGAKFLCSGYHNEYNKNIKAFIKNNKEFDKYYTPYLTK